MNRKGIQILVVVFSLILMGELLRFPQVSLTKELKQEGLIPEKLATEKQLKLGQTGAAVVLGGLRSLVASFMNLQAFGEYEKQDWVELERLFEIIVTLQPRNTYYWQTGSWHFAYNAYFDYEDKFGVEPPRRRVKQREYLEKGERFLLRGLEENPEQTDLWRSLGRMFNDPHKPYDFAKSAGYLSKAAFTTNAKPRTKREYFYTLGRVAGKEVEAWEAGSLLMQDPDNRIYPSMRSLFFTLSLIRNAKLADNDDLIAVIFGGNKRLAYRDLVNYWGRTKVEKFPRANLESVIKKLVEELDIPKELDPFRNPELRRIPSSFEVRPF